MGANILEFNGVVHSVVSDIPVDSEVPVVDRKGSVFKDAHRDRVCVPMFIGT